MATPVFCCGFECGRSVAHWTLQSAAATFVTSPLIDGLRSLRCAPSASATGFATTPNNYGAGLLVFRFHVNFATLPNATTAVATGGVTRGVYYNSSDGKLYAGTATSELGATGVPVTTGQTYKIDVRVNLTANPHLVDVSVDGVACGQRSTATTGSSSALAIRMGFQATCTADARFDNFKLSSTTGDYPLDDGFVLGFVANADGTHTATGTNIVKGTTGTPVGTAITSATTDAFNWLNARPILGGASDSTRLINQQSNAGTEYVELDFEPTVEVIPPTCVEVLVADREAGTGTMVFIIKLNDNGTEDVILSRATGATSDQYTTKHYATMVGGGAWSLNRFNALKMRAGYSTDALPDAYWRGAMIEADFPVLSLSLADDINT